MAGIARFLVSERYRKPLAGAIGVVAFLVIALVMAWVGASHIRDTLRAETEETLAEFERLRANITGTFEAMDAWLTAPPCSEPYMAQLRRVAYLPDGINEFFHAADGQLICSVNVGPITPPHELGAPDVTGDNPYGVAFWLDRELGFLGMEGFEGTIAVRGRNAMVIPPQRPVFHFPPWMAQQVVLVAPDGRWWHRSGEPGLYEAVQEPSAGALVPGDGTYLAIACDPAGLHCVVSRAHLGQALSLGWMTVAAALLAAAVLAAMTTQVIVSHIRRFWGFEARLRRGLEQGIVCVYQPIISTRTGEVTGCEVLVRWRDIDGSLVYPDRILPVIEQNALTMQLTCAVVGKALAELGRFISHPGFHVNFNIFPRDFEPAKLDTIFNTGTELPEGMTLIAELVESERLPIETVQAAIDHLRVRGIGTYIDDFGVGYSNIHNLGMLSLDGVKIDKSFAMAPDHSLMARILDHAIDMAHASGRAILIEGVETRERLDGLRANPLVDYAQGYFISRPLEIEALAVFLDIWAPFGDTAERPARPRLIPT